MRSQSVALFETRVQRLGLLIELGGVLIIAIDGAGMGCTERAVEESVREFKINGRELIAHAGRQQAGRFAFVRVHPPADSSAGESRPQAQAKSRSGRPVASVNVFFHTSGRSRVA